MFNLLVHAGGAIDGHSESTLVDQIGDIVHNVNDGLTVVSVVIRGVSRSSRRDQVRNVVSDRVDAPSDGDDESKSIESGLLSSVRALGGDLGSLSEKDLVDDVEPRKAPRNETAEDGNNTGLTGPAEEEHGDSGAHKLVEQVHGHIHNRGQDQVELGDLKGHGDEPVGVSVGGGRGLSDFPSRLHVHVVPESHPAHQRSHAH